MTEVKAEPVFLYFGSDWTAENRTSSHQVARWLAQHYRVYYLEAPGLRAPKTSGRDIKKVFAKFRQFFQGPRPVEAGLNLKRWTLIQVPLHRFSLVRRLNQLVLKAALRWLKWRERVQAPISWFLLPHMPFLVGSLGERLSVYYCIDDYASFPDMDAHVIRAMDDETTRRADVVFVASDTLLESKRRLNPNVHLSPHGVDYVHFARSQTDDLAIPDDLRDLPGSVVGYFGLVERWIDLDLVDYLAEQRPHWSFVLIGRVAVPDNELPRRPNIHYLGKRPYDQLPAYGRRFDASIIPYRLTQQVLHANPIKLREYLAMGKPVVSVSTPEIDKYADVVAVARSREEFLAALDLALDGAPSPLEVRRRQDRVARESWEARLQKVMECVEERLATTDTTALPLRVQDLAKEEGL